jgi:hypothetical protein
VDQFVTVCATSAERRAGTLDDARLGPVFDSLRTHGAAVVLDAVDIDKVDQLRGSMMAELDLAAATAPALGIPGHVQHNPPPRAADLHIEIFANPIAVSVATTMLGPGIHLSLYTGNTMLGGTIQAQPVHWDEPQLWPDLTQAPPAAALIVNIPLVDVTLANGALEVWPGTHLDVRTGGPRTDPFVVPAEWLESRREEVPPVRVPLPKGALLLRDSRMWHRGTTNATAEARPMVALLYTARWFRPYAIDFYADAEPVLKDAGIAVTPRYRESFDHHVWPPDWRLVPRPTD